MNFNAKTQRRGDASFSKFFAPLFLCTAIPRNHRAPRGFFRSADSLVRVFPPHRCLRADKAVRAPLVAAPSRCVCDWGILLALAGVMAFAPLSRCEHSNGLVPHHT